MNTLKIIDLAAPTVPAAEHDGLITLESLSSALEINIANSIHFKQGDNIELFINGNSTKISQIITDSSNPVYLMYLPTDYLTHEGNYKIGYELTGFPSGSPIDSHTVTIRIDRTAPGATLLAPIIFPQINFGEVLKGAIPGYADMQSGDRIQTLCNGIEGPVHVVTAHDLTDRPVQIGFERDFLTSLDSEHITLSYQITDRAGNVSIMAQLVELSIQR
ncbi:hypothetical protein [Pseudomonas viridiflava]|uniref:hypothetical protein n=1 Tax=Pseudomonas viridiflava TaxID=33069 RepID=UPI001C31D62F|nr:hypothetical protein [Pseudomonas viridiflava]QXG39421.1 hypothetical protein KTT55_18865 [Pseudomonas viridiflava]